jgi:glycosyltransferase involved in cell wall biosynthesis
MAGPLRLEVPERFLSLSSIRWLGSITRDQVGGLYREADIFVFPTHSDGFGLTQLEAQAWHLPLIASGNCGDVVVDGENGMLLEEVSTDAIRAALLRCRDHPQLLRDWSAKAGVAEQFQLAATGDALLAAIFAAQG